MPKTATWSDLLQTLFNGVDPYAGFNPGRFRPDGQGWNSDHPYLAETIASLRPRVVVEVGVWKGGSSIHMAEAMRSAGIDGAVIAIDTWLGSWEHYELPEYFPSLLMQNGYPRLYETFLTNVIERGADGHVLPLPLDSANAAFVLSRKGVSAQVIHIDAGHDYEAVSADLKRWWPLLESGGALIADDYDATGAYWPTVRAAVDDFLSVTPHTGFEASSYKARLTKP